MADYEPVHLSSATNAPLSVLGDGSGADHPGFGHGLGSSSHQRRLLFPSHGKDLRGCGVAMGDVAIRVENLGKQYRIGKEQARYSTLRDSLMEMARTYDIVLIGQQGDRVIGDFFGWL